jgi:glutamate carboxypeptidase
MSETGALLEAVREQSVWMLERLRELVAVESPSDCKAAVDEAARRVAELVASLGGRVRMHRQKLFGDVLELRFGPVRSRRKPVLLLGHLDTVWPLGTLQTMPWRKSEGRIFGPGVLDMKAGVVMALAAIRAGAGGRASSHHAASDRRRGGRQSGVAGDH